MRATPLLPVILGLATSRLFGDALSLLAAVFYGGYFLVVAYLRARLTTITIMTWTSLVAAAALLPLAIFKGEVLLPSTLAGILPLAGMALLVLVGMQAYQSGRLRRGHKDDEQPPGLLLEPVPAAGPTSGGRG